MYMIRKYLITAVFLFFIPFTASAQFETDTSQIRNPEFVSIADQLVQDLTTRLTLTSEQAEEIKEILIDYQENVSGTKAAENAAPEVESEFDQDPMSDTSTQSESQDPFQTENDVSADTSSVIQGDPQENANSAIESVLNDTQKTTWTVIKDAWWRDVNSRYGWEDKLENQE